MQLNISTEGIRAVELSSKSLVIDQPIHKISFCSPDPNNDRIFSYICREGSTKRWLCYVFVAFKGYSGERLSHAMGCAFAAKVKQKKDEEKKFEKEHKSKKKNQGKKKKKPKATPHSTGSPDEDDGEPCKDVTEDVKQLRLFHQGRQKVAGVDHSQRLKMESFESLESLEQLGLSSSDHSFDDQLDEIVSSRTSHSEVKSVPRDASTDVLILQERNHHGTNPWGTNFNQSNNSAFDPWGGSGVAVTTSGKVGVPSEPHPPQKTSKPVPPKSPSTSPILDDSDNIGREFSFEQELDSIVASRSSPMQVGSVWSDTELQLVVPPERDTNPWGTFQEVPSSAVNVTDGNTVTMETAPRKQSDIPLLEQPPSRTRPRPSMKSGTHPQKVAAPPTDGSHKPHPQAIRAPPTNGDQNLMLNKVNNQDDEEDFIALLERELQFSNVQPPSHPQPHPQGAVPPVPWTSSPIQQNQSVMLPPEQTTHWMMGTNSTGSGSTARWPY
jgi:hypothetical protein